MPAPASHMRRTMEGQPAELRRLLDDPGPVEAAARRLEGRRVWLCGTGTSWHAANHGAWMLGAAGVDAIAVQAADAAGGGPRPSRGDGLVLLSHTGAKQAAAQVLDRARESGVECVTVGARGRDDVDVETVQRERSSAYTASHTAALLRLGQLANVLGADLGALADVPAAVQAALEGASPEVAPPARVLELTGSGPNQWTAAEGALKVRETARVAAEGLSVEQLLHGPAVALGPADALVCLDGGGPGSDRLAEVAAAAQACGVRVHPVGHPDLGEELSVFALTISVQRIALECAEALGTDPDAFGYDVPGRRKAWGEIAL
jgi:glucosamine--fructose-6-phosphate aminotransferase (isomerizing)